MAKKKVSRKKTKTVKVTCTECGRVVRVSKGSTCHLTELCYACVAKKGKKEYGRIQVWD